MATLARRGNRARSMLTALVAVVLIGLFLQIVDSRFDGPDNPVKRIVVFAASPFVKAGSSVHRAGETAWLGIFGAKRLEEEIRELREDLVRARLGEAQETAAATIAQLTEEVSTTLPNIGHDVYTVSVLQTPRPGERQIAWIEGGTTMGLREGMVVLGPYGIVGILDGVYESTSKVLLLTDPRSTWGSQVDGRAELGLLRGTGNPRIVELHFDRTTTETAEADLIVTSGMTGSIAPGGLPFGRVISVIANKKGEPMALVELPQEPARLKTLFILPMERISVEEPK